MTNSIIIIIISTDEDPSLRIESSAIMNLRGVSTRLNKYNNNYITKNMYSTMESVLNSLRDA